MYDGRMWACLRRTRFNITLLNIIYILSSVMQFTSFVHLKYTYENHNLSKLSYTLYYVCCYINRNNSAVSARFLKMAEMFRLLFYKWGSPVVFPAWSCLNYTCICHACPSVIYIRKCVLVKLKIALFILQIKIIFGVWMNVFWRQLDVLWHVCYYTS